VVLCFFGEWRDEDARLRNPHPERNRIQETFGSKLQPTVYTALGRATLFHFAHCLTNSAKAGSDMAKIDACATEGTSDWPGDSGHFCSEETALRLLNSVRVRWADVTAVPALAGALTSPFSLIEPIYINNRFQNTWEMKQ
jgi:hypothetical protein